MLTGYGRLDTNSFFFSIQVEMYLVARTWLKEQRILTQNVFLVNAQTILELIKVFVQFPRWVRIETTLFHVDRVFSRLEGEWV